MEKPRAEPRPEARPRAFAPGRRGLPAAALVLSSFLLAAATEPPPAAPKDPPRSAAETRKPWPPTVPTENDILHAKPQEDLPTETFAFFGEEFRCELCLDEVSREIGMGARSEFPEGTAMIFVHPSPRVLNYWMKDCLIELDIVFVDAAGRIAAMYEARRERLRQKTESLAAYEARLPRYSSKRQVKYVIELPTGTLARLKPKVGDRVPIDWRALDQRAR